MVGEPQVRAPGHALPIEYLEGPYTYRGTMRGEPVTGIALYEASNAMYRDWELIDVLDIQISRHNAGTADVRDAIATLRSLVAGRDDEPTLDYLEQTVRPLLTPLPQDVYSELTAILDGLADAVRSQLR